MDAIITRLSNLPTTIRAYTIKDRNGDYNVFLNCRLSYERQLEAYTHELLHIKKGDFYKEAQADALESDTH